MSKQRTIRRTLLAMAMMALGANGPVLGEPWYGDDFDNAVPLVEFDQNGNVETSVTGRINNDWGTDYDYYSLMLKAGDVVTVDIDGQAESELDTALFVYDHRGTRKFEAQTRQDTNPVDPGSTKTTDSYVQFTADADGLWRVAVTSDPANPTGGWYTMFISRVSVAEAARIEIDIKPRDPHNATKLREKKAHHVRVALLSSQNFDPFTVDVPSLRFGRTGNENSLIRCASKGKDLNGDRKRDRVCRFDVTKTGFTYRDSVGKLKGTARGKGFEGSDSIKVIDKKQHNNRKHHDDDDDDDD